METDFKEKDLEARASFELINQMIANSRTRMERNAGRPLLIWGYTTVATTLAVCAALGCTGNPRWNYLWFALPIVGWLVMRLTRPQRTEGLAYTFVDRAITNVWTVMGLAAWFVSTLSLLAVVRPSILFVILLLMGCGTAITGFLVRFTPGVVGGLIGIVLAPVLLSVTGWWTPAVFIAGFVAMMIVPGHLLNYRSNHTEK